jgi:hypothetical protein
MLSSGKDAIGNRLAHHFAVVALSYMSKFAHVEICYGASRATQHWSLYNNSPRKGQKYETLYHGCAIA